MVGRPLPPPLPIAAAAAAAVFYLPDISGNAVAVGFAGFAMAPVLSGTAAVAAVHGGKLGRRLAGSLRAVALGLVFGWSAWLAAARPPAPGLLVERISRIDGRLADDPRPVRDGRLAARLELEAAWSGTVRASASGTLSVVLDAGAAEAFKASRGERLRLSGHWQEGLSGPCFFARSVDNLAAAPPAETWRNRLRVRIASGLGGAGAWGGLALALLVGDKTELAEGVAAGFTSAGCAHVLTLSGAHLAVITWLIGILLRRPLGAVGAAAAGCSLIAAYIWIAGGQPALLRSGLMYAFGSAAALAGWPRRLPALLAAAFLTQALLWPESVLGLSCALSYLALAGIAAYGPVVEELLRSWLPPAAGQALGAAVGAFLGTAAVSAGAFGCLRPIGLAAGLVVGPLASLLMLAAMAWAVAAIFFPPLASALGLGLEYLGRSIDWTVRTAALAPALPGWGAVPTAGLSLAVLAAVMYLGYRGKRRRSRIDRIA